MQTAAEITVHAMAFVLLLCPAPNREVRGEGVTDDGGGGRSGTYEIVDFVRGQMQVVVHGIKNAPMLDGHSSRLFGVMTTGA